MGEGVRVNVYYSLRVIGKRVVDFIELFLLSVTAEALRAKID